MKDLIALMLVGLMIFGFILICGIATAWLWNWLMPDLFGFKQISWLQAIGLMTLLNLLFNIKVGK